MTIETDIRTAIQNIETALEAGGGVPAQLALQVTQLTNAVTQLTAHSTDFDAIQTDLDAMQTDFDTMNTNLASLVTAIAKLRPVLANDPSSYNTAAADGSFTLGAVYAYGRNLYKYVQFLDAVAYEAGDVVEWADTAATKVTKDKSGGSSVGRKTAGIALAVMTQNYYGFILVEGYYAAVNTDGGVSAGEFLISDTVDGDADTMAAGEEHLVFGMALDNDTAADATATVKAIVSCL